MARFAVILAAAGRSSRFGSKGPHEKKVFRELKGRPVWLRSAEAFTCRSDVGQVLIVVSPEDEDWFRDRFRPNLAFNSSLQVVVGGAERADSVQNALARVTADHDYVAVHDAARPLITQDAVDQVFSAAVEHGAAILATPISSTVKRVSGELITETVPRVGLYAAQTPQVFRRELLLDAYGHRDHLNATDDAELVERLGHNVAIVPGSAMNLKITTREDLRVAGAFLNLLPASAGLPSLDALGPDNGPEASDSAGECSDDDGLDWLKRS